MKFEWKLNNEDECYDLLEIDAIETEEGIEDAVVAKVYDMGAFIHFCNDIGNESPVFPMPPINQEGKKNG